MKVTKKIIALLLAIVMAGCFFTGCKGNETNTPDAGTNTPVDTPTPDDPTPPPETDVPTPTPPAKPLYTFEKVQINEEAKTCFAGPIVIDRELCPIENENKEITEMIIPSEIDGYKVIGIAYNIMGQEKENEGFMIGDNYRDDHRCSVKTVKIPGTVETIQYGAFSFGSGSIENIIFEDESKLKLEVYPFNGTQWIKNVAAENNGCAVVNGVLVYVDPTLAESDGEVVLPDNVVEINDRLFVMMFTDGVDNTCYSFTVNEGCKKIGKDLFDGQKDNIEWIYIPASVESIAGFDFKAEDKPDFVVKTVPGSYAEQWAREQGFKVDCGYTFEKVNINEENKTCFAGPIVIDRDRYPIENENKEITEMIIPSEIDGYKVIGIAYNIMGQEKENEGFMIGDNYRDDHRCSVKTVKIPGTVETIQYGAFSFGSGSIENIIFEDESKLKLEVYPFNGTQWIKNVAAENNGCAVVNGVLVYVDPTLAESDGEVVLPDNVVEINARLFVMMFADGLDNTCYSFTVNEGCKKIGKDLFDGQKDNIEWIYIPASVESIAGFDFKAEDKPDFVVKTVKGCYADTWAQEQGFKVEYTK